MSRSAAAVVRNPLVDMPAAQRIRDLSPEARDALGQLLREMSADARLRAEKAWRTHKGPMAAYWKATAVYARHAAILTNSRKART